jgi:hypothetical protein
MICCEYGRYSLEKQVKYEGRAVTLLVTGGLPDVAGGFSGMKTNSGRWRISLAWVRSEAVVEVDIFTDQLVTH